MAISEATYKDGVSLEHLSVVFASGLEPCVAQTGAVGGMECAHLPHALAQSGSGLRHGRTAARFAAGLVDQVVERVPRTRLAGRGLGEVREVAFGAALRGGRSARALRSRGTRDLRSRGGGAVEASLARRASELIHEGARVTGEAGVALAGAQAGVVGGAVTLRTQAHGFGLPGAEVGEDASGGLGGALRTEIAALTRGRIARSAAAEVSNPTDFRFRAAGRTLVTRWTRRASQIHIVQRALVAGCAEGAILERPGPGLRAHRAVGAKNFAGASRAVVTGGTGAVVKSADACSVTQEAFPARKTVNQVTRVLLRLVSVHRARPFFVRAVMAPGTGPGDRVPFETKQPFRAGQAILFCGRTGVFADCAGFARRWGRQSLLRAEMAGWTGAGTHAVLGALSRWDRFACWLR